MNEEQVIAWLLEGDVSIQYQVWRDLLGIDKSGLQARIAAEGWGRKFLSLRRPDGHWGDRFYQPKWTSTHYTLLDLRNLNLAPGNEQVRETIEQVLGNDMAGDGGIRLGPSTSLHSDVCVNGMFLNYASYFHTPGEKLRPLADCLLREIMPDGGFNCRSVRSGARHSSLHSTLSVMEGFTEYIRRGYTYRINEIRAAQKSAAGVILQHWFFKSDHTGEVIDRNFLKFTYPGRWRYDILRALDHFQYAGFPYDQRMDDALRIVSGKQGIDGTWKMPAAHPGRVHFTMEKAGKAGRWNTLRALRVLKKYGPAERRGQAE